MSREVGAACGEVARDERLGKPQSGIPGPATLRAPQEIERRRKTAARFEQAGARQHDPAAGRVCQAAAAAQRASGGWQITFREARFEQPEPRARLMRTQPRRLLEQDARRMGVKAGPAHPLREDASCIQRRGAHLESRAQSPQTPQSRARIGSSTFARQQANRVAVAQQIGGEAGQCFAESFVPEREPVITADAFGGKFFELGAQLVHRAAGHRGASSHVATTVDQAHEGVVRQWIGRQQFAERTCRMVVGLLLGTRGRDRAAVAIEPTLGESQPPPVALGGGQAEQVRRRLEAVDRKFLAQLQEQVGQFASRNPPPGGESPYDAWQDAACERIEHSQSLFAAVWFEFGGVHWLLSLSGSCGASPVSQPGQPHRLWARRRRSLDASAQPGEGFGTDPWHRPNEAGDPGARVVMLPPFSCSRTSCPPPVS